MKKIFLIILFTSISFFVAHNNAQVAYANHQKGHNCWPWDQACVCLSRPNGNWWGQSCSASAGAPAPAPAAPAAPAAAVVPATSAPDDFSLEVVNPKCAISGPSVYLEWTDSTDAEKYEVHRRKQGERTTLGTPATLIFPKDATSRFTLTNYTDTEVQANTNYEYKIKAINGVGSRLSNFSEEKSTTTTCNVAAVRKEAADADRQLKLNQIKQTCTFEGQEDATCIQNATQDCLDSGTYDDSRQWTCIGDYNPIINGTVPREFSLRRENPIICDNNRPGIKLRWDDSSNFQNYTVLKKVNNSKNEEGIKTTTATVYIDYDLPNDLRSVSYKVVALGFTGLKRSSNTVTFPDAGAGDSELRMIANCKTEGRLTTNVPALSPTAEPQNSYLELGIDRQKFIGQEGEAKTTHVYAPGEPVRLSTQLFNGNLQPNNGCPTTKQVPQGAVFKIIKENDDGTTSEVRNLPNKPVCALHEYNMPPEVGNYIFRVEFSGEGNLLAAPTKELSFRVSKDREVVTEMVAYINGGGGKSNPIILYQDSPEFATNFVTDKKTGETRTAGTVDIGAKVFTASEDELCREAQISLNFERVAECLDKDCLKINKLTKPQPFFAKQNLANCQSYKAPEDGGLTEPGIYKLTAAFELGAKGTALKTQEATATLILRKAGFGQATIDADIGGALISKAKAKGAVAGIAVQKIGDQIVLKSDPNVTTNTIPVRACVRPKNNPNNIEAISGVRIMVEKFDTGGTPLGQAFNEVFPNDCQPKDIDLGSTAGVGCYNVNITDEDEDFEAKAVSKRLCFSETPAKAKPYTNISIDPAPGTISSVDDPTVTVATNEFSDQAHFVVLDDGKPYPVSPSSSNPVSDACKTGAGDCIYSLQIFKPNGNFDIKFCHDNQNNCTESLTFSTVSTPVATDPDQIVGVGLMVGGTEIPLPFDGKSIGIDLAPNSKQDQVFSLAIHRADKLRDSFSSLTFIYDEGLGATVPAAAPGAPTEGGAPTTGAGTTQPGGETAPAAPAGQAPAQQQACTPGEFNNKCTGACGGCAEYAGEIKVMQCKADGSGFDERGECSSDCSGPCQAVPAAQCPDVSFFPEPENGGSGCTKKFYTAFPECAEQFDIQAPVDSPGCS